MSLFAGQTAPGDGVCIAGESFWVNTHDVVVRHMRFRRGETKVWHRDDSFGGNPIGNIMIDHCSCTWDWMRTFLSIAICTTPAKDNMNQKI